MIAAVLLYDRWRGTLRCKCGANDSLSRGRRRTILEPQSSSTASAVQGSDIGMLAPSGCAVPRYYPLVVSTGERSESFPHGPRPTEEALGCDRNCTRAVCKRRGWPPSDQFLSGEELYLDEHVSDNISPTPRKKISICPKVTETWPVSKSSD